MRIISGKYKGKRLASVKGMKVRPTSDKLKGAIFNVLYSLGVLDRIYNMTVLDIFAGTGALGLEAISRGAERCFFIDNDPDSINAIKKNVAFLNVSEKTDIVYKSCKSGLSYLKERNIKPDLIFMDPPYNKNLVLSTLKELKELEISSFNSIIVAEHSKSEKLPDTVECFYKVSEKSYGDKVLSFFSANK